MDSRQVARCGVAVALLAVSACVTLPLGPVPFTLQTLVVAMLPVALGGRDALLAVACYLALGSLGLPVFSGLSGGAAHVLGPTGGYLWGFLVGTAMAGAVGRAGLLPQVARDYLGAALSLLTVYAVGTAQLCLVMGISPAAALLIAVAPFVGPDATKLLIGVAAGRRVRAALGMWAAPHA